MLFSGGEKEMTGFLVVLDGGKATYVVVVMKWRWSW